MIVLTIMYLSVCCDHNTSHLLVVVLFTSVM